MRSAVFQAASGAPAPDDFDLVDWELLRPPDVPIRGGSRTDAGIVLDRELTKLAAVEARCRLVRARIAAQLIRTRGWRSLGFARFGDFARERLGVSPRCLEQDAKVLRMLEDLPLLREMLETSALSWTRASTLTRVATPSNERDLLQASASVPCRDLEQFVREYGGGRDETGRAADVDASYGLHVPGGPTEDVSHAGVQTRAHGSTDDSGPPGNASAIGAEATSSHDDPCVRWSIRVSHMGRRLWRAALEYASRSAGSPLSPAQVLELVAAEAAAAAPLPSSRDRRDAPSPERHERRLRERLRRQERRGQRILQGFLAETGVAEGFPWLAPGSTDPGPAARLASFESGIEHADARELERRLRALRPFTQRLDSQMAALLRTGIDRRLFAEIGFASVKLYVESRLGRSARSAWNLVAIERASWRKSRALHEAWRDGRITSLQATTLIPVLDELNAAAWIDRAREVTLRRLEDEVAWALDFGPSPGFARLPLPPGPDVDVRGDLTGDVSDAEVQTRAHGPAREPYLVPNQQVRIDVVVPLSVAVLVETTLDRLVQRPEARWQAFERMVALALLDWKATPRHRDPIFERDGWRCAVPACSSRRNLHDHHVLYRSHGGGNARDNRVTVCAAHHLHGIHAGVIRARGQAPHDIRWEMGCGGGREPVMRLHGDRYI